MANAVETIITILTNDWNNANTDSITPEFAKVWDKKRIDFRVTAGNDWVLCYYLNPLIRRTNSSGTTVKETEEAVIIDIRTMVSEAHYDKVMIEIERILDANIINPSADYDLMDPDHDLVILHDKTNGLYRATRETHLINTCKTR